MIRFICVTGQACSCYSGSVCTFPKGGTLLLMAGIECSKSCPWPTQNFISCRAEQAGEGFEKLITEGALTSEFLTMIGHGEPGTREGAGKRKWRYSSS